MSSGFKSFNISLIFHAMIVVVISLFLSKKENIEMIESTRLITMNLGSFGSHGSGSPARKTAPMLHSSSSISTKTVNTQKTTTLSVSSYATTLEAPTGVIGSSAAEGNGLGSGAGMASGNGPGSAQDFSSSVMNYSEPVYPKMALRRGLEGTLKVKIKINSQGIPEDTTLLKSSGFDILDNSAMEAIKRWVFVKRESVAFYFVEKTIIFQITK